ncbi:hypothetical protein BDZ89DRAFT_1077445, partial [Hymenopellis radicata]
MAELNAAERAQVEALGQKIFDWQRLSEEHSAILRADPNAYAEAYQQYAAKAPQIGTVPPRGEYEEHILLGEQLLEKECVTFYDRVEAVNTLAYLCRLQMTLIPELIWPVQKAIREYVEGLIYRRRIVRCLSLILLSTPACSPRRTPRGLDRRDGNWRAVLTMLRRSLAKSNVTLKLVLAVFRHLLRKFV